MLTKGTKVTLIARNPGSIAYGLQRGAKGVICRNSAHVYRNVKYYRVRFSCGVAANCTAKELEVR